MARKPASKDDGADGKKPRKKTVSKRASAAGKPKATRARETASEPVGEAPRASEPVVASPAPATAVPAPVPPSPPPPARVDDVAAPAPSSPRPATPPARPAVIALPPDEEGWEPLGADAVADGPTASPRATPSAPLRALPPDEEGWVPLVGESVSHEPGEGGAGRGAASPRIPPLPDAEFDAFDDGEPYDDEGDDDEGSDDDGGDDLPRTPPEGATARQIYDAVRAGTLHVSCLDTLPDDVVAALLDDVGLEVREGERRTETLYRLLHHRPEAPEPPTYETEGLLELVPEGFGFLRSLERGYFVGPFDAYVPTAVIRRLSLRPGHWVSGTARAPKPGERYPTLVHVEEVNHEDPSALEGLPAFDSLVVTHPDRRYVLETEPDEVAMRVVDLFCPLGRGQRALIVSPPRAGKTILLQKIADSVATNYPEVEIVVLLVDERPEEVTHMRRTVRGEVIASTFDQPPHRHVRVAELAMEKVKRLVELRRHVVLLIDSLTRLGRAYNNESGGTGRLLTGGLEATALTSPKRFFGAARNIEHGGSLTIVASALVDTGSRLDQVIFEEFKGTGNMEIVLSREVANQRVWPAIDVARSGTRREDLLLHPDEQRRVTALRREVLEMDPAEAMLEVRARMQKYRTNAELLMRVSAD